VWSDLFQCQYLVIAASLSYLLSPSPFELITRLSAGGHYIGITSVAAYFLPLAVLGGALFLEIRLASENGL
jgi:hypothetical protein